MTRAIITKLLFFLTLCSCRPQEIPTSEEFNKEARNYFLESYKTFDLSPLDDFEKCVLRKVIENGLDELGSPKTVILHDKYFLKEFYDDFLQLHFSFIKEIKSGKFYFLCLPQLDEFIDDVEANYLLKNDSIYELKFPQTAVKINTDPLLNFLSGEQFKIHSGEIREHYSKFRYTSEIMTESFRLLQYSDVLPSTLQNELEKDLTQGRLSKYLFSEAVKLMNDAVLKGNTVKTYYFRDIGFLIILYSVAGQPPRVGVDMFFIPKKERVLLSRAGVVKYSDCRESSKNVNK